MTGQKPQRTVLVIDDDEDFTASLATVLETAGYAVVTADSGSAGLSELQSRRPDLVVLDVMMESSTEGYSVNEAIKYSDAYAAVRDTPIIMVSSISEAPDERFPRAPEVDMIRPDRYFRKPLDIPRFLEVIKAILRA